MLDGDGYVTSWNPGAERIKGYSKAEIAERIRAATPENRTASAE